ncbi:Vms1/Ankzf1 family peptidyl-tRNA hydrolase [Cryptosporangium phraense]|uniref:Peptide chain release factor 2 n=1 Tax=Cryptosporangium phraense TaxID=2593070 RepID=A0A545AID2_9ACTN|nr:Vms1/Ankzf1 family peptidyl-tRNA hydrolase [Cryptosporangium phraense]TQS41020.1 peptide chain release factor 2 [Cryptosporangium phraense]
MELEFLSELAVRPGPFVTVYLDASHNTPGASRQIDVAWQDARRDLVGQGADEATLTALDKAASDEGPSVGSAGRVFVAAHGEVLLDRTLPEPPRRPIARVSPLPHLMPLLRQYPEPLPYVVVVVDRAGADVSAFASPGAPLLSDSVAGPDQWPLHKVPGGGWSALRYQHAVEVAWEHNAAAVASEVTRVVDAVHARLVVIAGDVRARGLLRDELPPHVSELAVETEAGSRAAGSDPSRLESEVTALLGNRVASARADLLEHLGAGYARDTAAQGLEALFGALREGMVDTAFLVDDRHSDLTVAVGPEPLQVALADRTLEEFGVSPIEHDRADAALVRALAASGAKLEIIVDEQSTDEDLGAAPAPAAPADDLPQPPKVEFTDGVAVILRRPGAGIY